MGIYSEGSVVVACVTFVKEMTQTQDTYSVSGLAKGTAYFVKDAGESFPAYEEGAGCRKLRIGVFSPFSTNFPSIIW